MNLCRWGTRWSRCGRRWRCVMSRVDITADGASQAAPPHAPVSGKRHVRCSTVRRIKRYQSVKIFRILDTHTQGLGIAPTEHNPFLDSCSQDVQWETKEDVQNNAKVRFWRWAEQENE